MANLISARYQDLMDRIAASTKSIDPVARCTDEASRASEVFNIVLPERIAGEEFGLYMNLQDGHSLLVEGVNEDEGLVNRFNISNPDKRVKVGDRITDVNDINGNAVLLLDEIRSQKRLAIKVVREFSEGFSVVIPYREAGEELGLHLDLEDDKSLLIEGINEGLLDRWNISNPDQRVKVGDRIMDVNGINGNARLMLAEVTSRKSLVIQIARPASGGAPSAGLVAKDVGLVEALQQDSAALQQLTSLISEELVLRKEKAKTMHLRTEVSLRKSLCGPTQQQPGHANVRPVQELAQDGESSDGESSEGGESVDWLSPGNDCSWKEERDTLVASSMSTQITTAAIRGELMNNIHPKPVNSGGNEHAAVQTQMGVRVHSTHKMSEQELAQAEARIIKNIHQLCGEDQEKSQGKARTMKNIRQLFGVKASEGDNGATSSGTHCENRTHTSL